jgi:DNA-binding response OmpR family regulator
MADPVRLLHVEDDPLQHRLVQVRLKAVPDLTFETTWALREDEALAAFGRERFDLVLLDYVLEQGDGLHLLRELRARDPVVPIIALSGTATAQVAADLIRGGADDYFDKAELSAERFSASIRFCIDRAAKLRGRKPDAAQALGEQLAGLTADFTARLGPDFFDRLDRLVSELRTRCTTLAALEELFARETVPTAARPVLLEIATRLFGDDRAR